jgi:hypothetical protein
MKNTEWTKSNPDFYPYLEEEDLMARAVKCPRCGSMDLAINDTTTSLDTDGTPEEQEYEVDCGDCELTFYWYRKSGTTFNPE